MEFAPSPYQLPHKPWIDRLQALFEVLLLSGLASSFFTALVFSVFRKQDSELMATNANFISAFLLAESIVTFVLLAIIMKAHGETLSYLGLRRIRWKSNLLIGLLMAPLLLLINGFVGLLFRLYLPNYYLEKNPLTATIHTPQQLAFLIFAALIAGGIKEELQRAFILQRFGRYLGGAGLGLLLWSAVFGAGHYVQGLQGIVTATVYGFIFGLFYLIRRSLVGPIVSHAAYDTLALLLYWFTAGARQ